MAVKVSLYDDSLDIFDAAAGFYPNHKVMLMGGIANKLNAVIDRYQCQIEALLAFVSAGVANASALSDWDFCVADVKHAPNDFPRMQLQLRSPSVGQAHPVMRIVRNDLVQIKKWLTIGVQPS